MRKLYTLNDVMPARRHDSVKDRMKRYNGKRNIELLTRCNNAWDRFDSVRKTRERTHNYTFVDQWNDLIEYRHGMITEREYIKRKGNVPLQNNVMISIFNTLTGVYEKQGVEPLCFARDGDSQWLSDMMSATLQANWQDTGCNEIMKTVFKDYLIGGVAVTRETYEEREEQWDTWTDYVNPNNICFEGGADPRHHDMNLVCELHDIPKEDLYSKFARPEYGLSVNDLNDIFQIDLDYYKSSDDINEMGELGNMSFSTPANKNYYRVIECWTKETKSRYQCTDPIATNADDARFRVEIEDIGKVKEENMKRKRIYDESGVPQEQRAYITAKPFVDVFWYYTFMSPDGTVLCEGESPFEYKSHPYTIKLYPFVNGEVHPFMTSIIDQQRYINRLVVMHDMAARTAAKGITIVPRECIPDDMNPEDFADQFTEYDGIVIYDTSRLNPNAKPQVITSNAVQIGTTELLNLQLQLTKDITNVSGALQGKTPSAGTSAARYNMEQSNATTSIFSLLNDMTAMTEQIAKKKVSNIKQFYDDGRRIIGSDPTKFLLYDRLSARDISFKISVKEGGATAAYQQQANEVGMQLLQMGAIDAFTFLESSSLPFKDKYLQAIQARQAQIQAEQMAQGAQQPNMQNQQAAQQMLQV